MSKISGIYVILNMKNGKVYIGQAQDFRRRWSGHRWALRGNYHHNHHLQAAWNKYGEQGFKFQKLEYCSIEQLDEREQHYLDTYMAKGLCYNIAADVQSPTRGQPLSEEHKRKIGVANKGKVRAPISEETRRKISEANRGRKPPPITEETRRKISEANKRRAPDNDETRRKKSEAGKAKPPMSGETRRKIGNALRDKRHSDEQCLKNSEGHKGKRLSEETRRNISIAAKQRESLKRAQRETDETTQE